MDRMTKALALKQRSYEETWRRLQDTQQQLATALARATELAARGLDLEQENADGQACLEVATDRIQVLEARVGSLEMVAADTETALAEATGAAAESREHAIAANLEREHTYEKLILLTKAYQGKQQETEGLAARLATAAQQLAEAEEDHRELESHTRELDAKCRGQQGQLEVGERDKDERDSYVFSLQQELAETRLEGQKRQETVDNLRTQMARQDQRGRVQDTALHRLATQLKKHSQLQAMIHSLSAEHEYTDVSLEKDGDVRLAGGDGADDGDDGGGGVGADVTDESTGVSSEEAVPDSVATDDWRPSS
jgi:chromosome segregation ATPase